jgi:hypothetical protein
VKKRKVLKLKGGKQSSRQPSRPLSNQLPENDSVDSTFQPSLDLFIPNSDHTEPDLEGDIDLNKDARNLASVNQTGRKRLTLPLAGDAIHEAHTAVKKPRYNYAERLHQGFTSVSIDVYEQERQDGHAIAMSMNKTSQFAKIAISILASIPDRILQLVVSGNLAQAVEANNDPELIDLFSGQEKAWKARCSKNPAPGCYGLFLTDKLGQSPTPRQFHKIIACLRGYVSGRDDKVSDVADIDNGTKGVFSRQEDIEAGGHWFLKGSSSRATKVLTFCKALESRLNELPSNEQDIPLKQPLKYIGYSVCIEIRVRSHENQETSWLMHLVLAVCRFLFRDGIFSLKSYALCFMATENEVPVAEVLLGVISNSSYETGGGFSVYQGGCQISSSRQATLSESEKKRTWVESLSWRKKNTPYTRHMDEEKDRQFSLRPVPGDPIAIIKPPSEIKRETADKLKHELVKTQQSFRSSRSVEEKAAQLEQVLSQIVIRPGSQADTDVAEAMEIFNQRKCARDNLQEDEDD